MCRHRIVKGKIIKKTTGNHLIYAGSNITRTALGELCDTGADSGVSYNDKKPEQPDLPSLRDLKKVMH